jgi:prepilin-type processing-associated H-X9-DG protein
MYNQLQVGLGTATVPLGADVLNKTLAVFVCPTDAGGEQGPSPITDASGTPRNVGFHDGSGSYYKKSNYVAVNGTGLNSAGAPAGPMPLVGNPSLPSIRGCFGQATATAIHHILDGTTNTIMIGERDMTKNCGAIWIRAANAAWTGGFDNESIVGVAGGDPIYKINATDWRKLITPSSADFGSMHAGGCQFVLADGSVRFISENIDLGILEKLAAHQDGGIVSDF